MKKYFLSIMKGQKTSFIAQLIVYLLLPWSMLYAVGVFCHRSFYRLKGAYKASKPVISIGNITVGGVGKTPLVIWLARHLQDKGIKSIILIRGYMPKGSKDSDEVDMLNEQIPYIPVIAGPDRIKNIRKSQKTLPVDVYICDDAFQHWPLGRNLDIVAIDAGNPFGNGYLLPAGILREPLYSLKRADVLLLTKIDEANDTRALRAKLEKLNPRALIVESRYKSSGVVDAFGEKPLPDYYLKDFNVVGFCAIGDPVSFESSLRNTGAKIAQLFTFMDHHVYKKDDIERMLGLCRSQNIPVLVTTHKDVVKLRVFKEMFTGFRLVYIPIQLEITKGSDEFIQKVISICLN
jgi:tetraacyldisaccharide 4'-kinase